MTGDAPAQWERDRSAGQDRLLLAGYGPCASCGETVKELFYASCALICPDCPPRHCLEHCRDREIPYVSGGRVLPDFTRYFWRQLDPIERAVMGGEQGRTDVESLPLPAQGRKET